jgi:hypothetical protein
VGLRTKITGGVAYQRIDLDASGVPLAPLDDGDSEKNREVTRWETTRILADKESYEAAKKVQGKARSLIAGTCAPSDFGPICLEAREADLDAAYAEALARVEAHNAKRGPTRVSVYMAKGRVASTDEQAAKGIADEVRGILDTMKVAMSAADVGAIREAASKARSLGRLLDADTATKLGKAVEEARSAAKAIVKRIETGGEDAALVLQELSRKAIDEARFCFLDLDAPVVPDGGNGGAPARVLDLDDSGEIKSSAPESRALDLDATADV